VDRLSDYDYDLPPDRIAQQPLEDRSASKLLLLDKRTGEVRHRTFRDIVDILEPGDLLVLNDTRVTAMRVFGRKESGGQVEMLLLKALDSQRYEALVRPSKRLKMGAAVLLEGGLRAVVGEALDGPKREVSFPNEPDAVAKLAAIGQTPLPPYVREAIADPERYQTVYAETGGSAAAPTAGLHFTPEILEALARKGVKTAKVTLDVSLDTFRPVEAENLDEHVMHGEEATLPPQTKEMIESCAGRIVAVGTTVVRTLESFAVGARQVEPGTNRTRLFIRPGHRFLVVDALLTNFHMPRTTMLVLVSSLAGREHVLRAYREALLGGYRFLSFGDAMLVI
jgi:S-adenosylmethionine:tRNA ribosyltransferase-isomerase